MSDARTHHYQKRIRIYACSFKYQEQAVDVDSPFSNCSELDMSLVHSWKPSYSPSNDWNSFWLCWLYMLVWLFCRSSYLYNWLHFLSFPNKQTNETLLVCFLWSSSSMALIRQETYMYTNNDCFKNNDVWTNYSKFVNISYAWLKYNFYYNYCITYLD